MLIIGVVLIIAGLWLSFYGKPMLEGMADTSLIVMIGTTGSNMYFADQGLTNSPNWAQVGGSITQMSGSRGRVVGVRSNSLWYGTQYNIPGSQFNWVAFNGTMTQVSFDYPFLLALDTGGVINYVDDVTSSSTLAWKQNTGLLASKPFKWVSASIGRAYAIGTDNLIWYVNNVRTGSWLEVTGSLTGKTFTQIVFDANQVYVIDDGNKVYYADSNYQTDTTTVEAPTWTPLPGNIKQLSVQNNMAIAIGPDNTVYFASNARTGNWNPISKPTNFTWVEVMNPVDAKMITERPADMTPCTSGYSFYNGFCGQQCPGGYTVNQFICTGIPVGRTLRPATIVPPTYYTCPTGFDVRLGGTTTCRTIVGGTLASVAPIKEVFSVGTGYTQQQAQDKCVEYGATLANTTQMKSTHAAGANWCIGGWVTDNTSAILYPRNGCETGASGLITAPLADGLAAANCYGVKPPPSQFTDIRPFKTDTWNMETQCPVGYNINTTGACNSTCPTGAWGNAGSCVSPTFPKDSTPANLLNYTCPAGYDPPDDAMCSESTCGKAQTCYSTCPAGTTPRASSCSGAITAKKTAQAAAPVQTGVICPAGQTLSGTTCYVACKEGDTNTSATTCSTTVMKKVGALTLPTTTTYNKASSPATIAYGPYTCPTGWTLTNLTCYQNCAAGTTDIGGNQCQATGTARTTTQASYTAPCPAGASLANGKCFKGCPPGSIEVDNMTCQNPTIPRTTATPNTIKSPLTPCSSSEETFTETTRQVCSPLCPTGHIASKTSCTPPTITRPNYAAKYSCSSNETLQNGMCVSKCPAGTYPNGELCMADEQVVPVPSTFKCTSKPYLKGKKWLCDTQADADILLKDPSPTSTYVAVEDQVCVSDDPTLGMYYCQSGEEAKANRGSVDTLRTDYNNTCASMKKNYLDLSGSLNSLMLIQSGMYDGTNRINAAQTALNNIYSQLNCTTPANAQLGTLCNQIKAGSTAMGKDSSNISNVLLDITVPIQAALDSRSSLLASIAKFQCTL